MNIGLAAAIACMSAHGWSEIKYTITVIKTEFKTQIGLFNVKYCSKVDSKNVHSYSCGTRTFEEANVESSVATAGGIAFACLLCSSLLAIAAIAFGILRYLKKEVGAFNKKVTSMAWVGCTIGTFVFCLLALVMFPIIVGNIEENVFFKRKCLILLEL